MDLLENMPEVTRQNVVIFKNCMSPVPGFEANAELFFENAKKMQAEVVEFTPTKKLKMN